MNKSLYVKTLTIICLMISLPLVSGGHKADEHGSSNKNETTASDWVTAGYTGKELSMNMVEQNMAEDGHLGGSFSNTADITVIRLVPTEQLGTNGNRFALLNL